MQDNTIFRYGKAYLPNIYKYKLRKSRNGERLKRQPSQPARYNGTPILPREEGSAYIENIVNGERPFAIARLIGTELSCAQQYLRIQLGIDTHFSEKNSYIMANNAGFFPADDVHLHQYGALLEAFCPSIDIMTVFSQYMEDYVINTWCDNPKLIRSLSLNPIYSPWTRALQGKRVLTIHPFAELMLQQYEKRELLFPGKDILPEFDLRVYPAVQTSAGQKDERFGTWFEALDFMMEDIKKFDFDIALIGAGAYGLPLAVKIKNKMQKKAVQMGGVLQILFGIRGKRWDHSKRLQSVYNEYWIRPGDAYTPENADKVEGGCYW